MRSTAWNGSSTSAQTVLSGYQCISGAAGTRRLVRMAGATLPVLLLGCLTGVSCFTSTPSVMKLRARSVNALPRERRGFAERKGRVGSAPRGYGSAPLRLMAVDGLHEVVTGLSLLHDGVAHAQQQLFTDEHTTLLADSAASSGPAGIQAARDQLLHAGTDALKQIEALLSAAKASSSKYVGAVQAPLKGVEGSVQKLMAELKAEQLLKALKELNAGLPKPVQLAEQELSSFVSILYSKLASAIHEVSRDGDADLFNGYPFNARALGLWFASIVSFASVARREEELPYPGKTYDPAAAERYFSKRWVLKYGRAVQLGYILGGWGIGLLRDRYEYGGIGGKGNKWEKNMPMRAKQLLGLTQRLGTTAIKIGQALSIRGDILPAPYVKELSELQDRVKPFPNHIAMDIVEQELRTSTGGKRLKEIFRSISSSPVAAASIGQVYKAELMDGREVAVKVQRPEVIRDIALDLYVCRSIAPLWKKFFKLNSDLVGLIDEWGAGFVNELDYEREAINSQRFLAAMQARSLDAVTTAKVVPELSAQRVLTTRWVVGERLEKSSEEDVGRLCGVALNAYLTMLLDTGLLHCDPHPGNLLRTEDGKLCILDFGMCIEVEKELQYALIEYIAHLMSEDYQKIPGDLIQLGFVPAGKEALIQRAGVVEALSVILRQLAMGGGPKKVQERMIKQIKEEFGDLPREEIREKMRAKFKEMNEQGLVTEERVNVGDVARKMEQLQEDDNNYFQIPPWMAYILRTFSVLEGIGLQQDEDYSIAQECYPYLAKRLFSDNSPRAQEALRQMLYGSQEGQGAAGALNVARLKELSSGFQSYTASTSSVEQAAGLDRAADQVIELLLSPQGNFVQQVLLEELAAIVDAGGRSILKQATLNPIGSAAVEALKQQRALAQQLPPALQSLVSPVFLPAQLTLDAIDLITADEEDEASLQTATKLWNLLQSLSSSSSSSSSDSDDLGDVPPGPPQLPQLSSLLGGAGPRLPQSADELRSLMERLERLQPGLLSVAARLSSILLQRTACRLEERVQLHGGRFSPVSSQFVSSCVSALDSFDAALNEFAAERLSSSTGAGGAQEQAMQLAAAALPGDVAPRTNVVRWTEEARKELERAPFFVRGPAKQQAEEHAKKMGYAEIDMAVIEESRRGLSDVDVAKKIVGMK